ncbi:MAG: methyltransferase domain-containing protein [Myxococcales bacterium]|nr:methyltransferase domain-containing protein [Myxococcales bacterium]
MLTTHLERLGLVCPSCRAYGRPAPRLELGTIVQVDTGPAGDDLIEGVLVCPACMREHPILDGIVVAVANIGSWTEHQLDAVMRRHDLSPFMESMLGDAAGRGGSFDRERHDLSTYGTSHWGDLDRAQPLGREGSLAALLETAAGLLPTPPTGLWLDTGCAVARGTLELAAAGAELVVGVDLNMSMLRRAEQARRTGHITWPRRRVGQVFDTATAATDELPRERVAFVCADVGTLPFADATFAGALSLNVLDCVPSPVVHLIELGRVLVDAGAALLSTPYDWTTTAAAMEHWIGGHSQRGDHQGSSEAELRRLLSPELRTGIDTGLTIADELEAVPWHLTLNARSVMHYQLHLLRLARTART